MTRDVARVVLLGSVYALVAYVLASLVRPDLAVFVTVVVCLAGILHVWVTIDRGSRR